MVVKTAADETLRIKVDGACYTFPIGDCGAEDLKKIKVLIQGNLLALCDQREYLWHKLRQINGELDRRVTEKACQPTPGPSREGN